MNLKKKEYLKYEIIIDIPSKNIKKENEKKITELSKSLQIKGFRKGFVPKRLVMERFGDSIHQENLNTILNDEFIKYIKKENLNVVDKPSVEKISENKDGHISFKLEFEIFPKIDINFANIKIKKYITEITNEDIKNEIYKLRLKHHEWQNILTKSIQYDHLIIDLYKKTETESQYILNKEEVVLDEKTHHIENLKLYLVNKDANTEYSFSMKNNKLCLLNEQNDDHVYVLIHSIKRKILADINKEFLIKLGFKEDDTTKLDYLIEEKLKLLSKYLSEKLMKTEILNSMVNSHDFDIPEILIKQETNDKRSQDDVIKNLKLRLLLLEIKKKFNINISKMEIEEHIKSLYSNEKNVVEKKSFIESVEKEMYIDKILKVIESKIDITNEKISLDQLIKIGGQK